MTFQKTVEQEKALALANYLRCNYSEAVSDIENDIYGVYTEDEAREKAYYDIEQSLWAFNQSFISRFSKVARAIDSDSWKKMAGDLCEGFNDAVLAMIEVENDVEDVYDAAIDEDGIGHFLNTYDGEAVDSDDECDCELTQNYIICQIN
jgi:hypothetical protein